LGHLNEGPFFFGFGNFFCNFEQSGAVPILLFPNYLVPQLTTAAPLPRTTDAALGPRGGGLLPFHDGGGHGPPARRAEGREPN